MPLGKKFATIVLQVYFENIEDSNFTLKTERKLG